MALPNDGVPPDRFELRVRFVCGGLLGGLLGLRLASLDTTSPAMLAVAVGAGAIVGGLLARHFGDRFWHTFLRLLRWR